MVDGSSQTRIGRTPSAAIERGDWKPIDYGHPMRDPTLVYGIQSIHLPVHVSKSHIQKFLGTQFQEYRDPYKILASASHEYKFGLE